METAAVAKPASCRYLLGMNLKGNRNFVNPCLKLAGAFFVLVATMSPTAAFIGDWTGEGHAKARLIAAGVDADGRLAAGIEIVLDPGWKTYWRSPGDAGIAPVADFSASVNIAQPVAMAYPVPHRFDDGYSVTNVYEDHVIFPVSGRVVDPRSDTRLAVALDLGVCEEICIPEHYDLAVDLTANETDSEAAAVLAEVRAKLPRRAEPGVFAAEGVTRAGGDDKRPVFAFEIVAPDAATAEVFVEGPVDWYPGPPTLVTADGDRATYSFQFSRFGSKTPVGGNDFRVTIVSAGSAVEDTVTLD